MGYNRFRFGIIWRIGILLLIWTAVCYSVLHAGWVFLTILLLIVAVVDIAELIFYVSRIHRDVDQCLQSILANDFSVFFPDQVNSGNKAIRYAANAIVTRFKELQLDKERLLRLTDLVMANLPVAVICFAGEQDCCIYNESAERTLGLKIPPTMEKLKMMHEGLFAPDGRSAAKRVIKLQIGSDVNQYAVRNITFKLGGIEYYLVTMENISSEMDQVETDSWRDLMRVLNHEIVNSITPIVSLSESLTEDLSSAEPVLSADERVQAAKAISSRSVGLLKFAQGYRLFTTLKEPQKQRLLVSNELNAVKQLFAAEKNHTIQLETSESVCFIDCDQSHLGQILVNLLRNAFESYDEGISAGVKLGYNLTDDGCELYVEDQGRGMDDTTLAKVFIPYFTTREVGQGLGLSLCKQLVQLNGGRMQIRSRIGLGTRVSVVFAVRKGD